ncbi:hypothetical protein CTRI78_v005194 [Colletotrichum trifolii]|uniref:Uncharacterized protein n=1 Tax=Colletotrichum trifolii TaxID=5466 RepID=A0A4R8RF53_COLTR|nr:hypothetical protein CTRI78_v005194 [Colletotrichum trifolii]
MVGDARKKGGAYSDNPVTMRHRQYEANLAPEKLTLRRRKFCEYRALRATCLKVSESEAYKTETTRDGKLHHLRIACNNKLTNRIHANIPSFDPDVEAFVTRFHDGRWVKGLKKSLAANDPIRQQNLAFRRLEKISGTEESRRLQNNVEDAVMEDAAVEDAPAAEGGGAADGAVSQANTLDQSDASPKISFYIVVDSPGVDANGNEVQGNSKD